MFQGDGVWCCKQQGKAKHLPHFDTEHISTSAHFGFGEKDEAQGDMVF
jgi:hypothetical protein